MVSPNTLSQSGAQSATFIVAPVEFEPGFFIPGKLTALDWAALPKGKLKDLLNKQYRSGVPLVPDFDLFFDDCADAGFSSVMLQRFPGEGGPAMRSETLSWALDAEGYPEASTTGTGGKFIARIETSYSASE